MWAAALAAILGLLCASCVLGGDSSGPPAPSRAGTACPPAAGVTDGAVMAGLLYPDSGNAASLFAPFRAGVEARLGVANDVGGVNGRRVTHVWQDDGSRPDLNLKAARRLVEQRQVFGIMESTTGSSGSAEFLHDGGIPVVGTSLDGAWTVYDNMFSYSNMIAEGASVTTWGEFVAEQGGTSALIAVAAFSAASGELAEELTASLEAAGVRVVGTVDATGPINLRAIGNRVRDSGADALVGAVTGAAFGQVVLGARAVGANLRVMLTPSGYDQTLLELFGPVLGGVNLFVDYQPFELDLPGHRAFLDGMARHAPYLQPQNQQGALAGWITADMFLRGLTEAGPCPTRQSFVDGLRAVRDYSAGGLLPARIDFTASFGQLGRCYTFMRVRPDGSGFEVLRPAPRCGTLQN